MATNVFKGSFTANTSTGNQSVTGLTFQPAIVFFWTNAQTSAAWATGNYSLSFGWGVSSTKRGVCAIAGTDAVGTQDTGRSERSAGCILLYSNGTPTVDAVADFVSQNSNGFTINWTDAPASAVLIHYLAVGGSGVTAHASSFGSRTGVGTQAVTGYGGTPDLYFVMENLTAIDSAASTNAVFGLGAAASTTSEGAIGVVDRDASATMVVSTHQRSDRVLVTSQPTSPPVLYHEVETSTFDADGFTLNFITNTATGPIFHCGLLGIDAAVVASSAPTANGTQAISGLSFAPAGFLALSVNRASSTALDTAGDLRLSIFGASKEGTNAEGGIVWTQDQGNTNSNYDRLYSTTRAIVHANIDQVITAEADVQSWDSAGVTLDWVDTDATSRETLFIFFGPADTGLTATATAGTVTLSAANSTTLIRDTATAGTVTLSAANSTGTGRRTATAGSMTLSASDSAGKLTHPSTPGSITLSAGDSSTANRTSVGTLTVSSPDSATVTRHTSTAGQITLSQGNPTGAAVKLVAAGTVTMSMSNPTEATLGLASSGTLSLSMANPTSRVMLSATSASISMSAGDSAGAHVAPVQSATLVMSFTEHTTDIPVVAGPSDVWNPRRRRRI